MLSPSFHDNKVGKKRIHNLPYGSRKHLLYGFVVYSGKGTKSFDVSTGDQELEVRTATYGPEID